MANKILLIENNSINNVDANYMGDIEYSTKYQQFSSGEIFDNKDIVQDPVSYNSARGICSILTKNNNYDEVFDNIREDKSYDNAYNDITKYSFSSKVGYYEDSFYWVYKEDNDGGELSYEMTPDQFTSDNYFYFKFIDASYCKIIKNTISGEKYLTYDTTQPNPFVFRGDGGSDLTKFTYSYNSVSNIIILCLPDGSILGTNDQGGIQSVSINSFINNHFNAFTIDKKNSLDSSEKITNSFLPRYDINNNISQKYEVDNTCIFTHNYKSNKYNNSNYIPLKSNVTYDENYSLVNSNLNTFFRQYTSIDAGIRGDSGYSNYILSYNSDWYKFEFTSDKQTYFNIPFELGQGYTKINIQDCR